MLISKLADSYPSGDKSLLRGKVENIDPIFLGRLARLAEVMKTSINITEGFRSYAVQAMYYQEYLQYKRTGKLGKHGIKLASPPGNSLHEMHLAVDVSTAKIKALSNSQLRPFGLIKPIASENWHIQPIEITKGVADAKIIDSFKPFWWDEKMQTIKIYVDGKVLTVEGVNAGGTNLVKLRDLDEINKALNQPTEVSYNKLMKMPEVKAL